MTWKALACASFGLLASQGVATAAPAVPVFGVYDLTSQRLSGDESVRMPGAKPFAFVSVLVTVDVDGRVIDAAVAENTSKVDTRAALAAARRWTFRPQSFDGHPIEAVGTISIQVDPPEIVPNTAVPFPVAAPEDVEITLERGACLGSCPDYRVTITGDGRVRFSTRDINFPGWAAEVHRRFSSFGQNVLWPGTHQARVSPQAVAALVTQFRAAHFMGMKREYVAAITDNPAYALTLRVGHTTKRVVDYVGMSVGMPASMTALEEAVDTLAGTDRWVRGNGETIALLQDQGFDFTSPAAAALVQSAIRMNDWPPDHAATYELIQAAIGAGLDVSAPVEAGDRVHSPETATIGAVIAGYAATTGNAALFDEMARQGQVARMRQQRLDAAFVSDMGCNARLAKALVAAGANPTAVGEDGNALHALRRDYGRCAEVGSQARVDMARTLVALGVPLEARDRIEWTPLMGCDDPAVAEILLNAGANPNARDSDGTTVVLSLDDDRAVLTVLRAGADPNVKDRRGTLRQQARERHWPATLAWLDAHAIK